MTGTPSHRPPISSRREFIRWSAAAGLGASMLGRSLADRVQEFAAHLPGTIVAAPDRPLPEGARAPFGWEVNTVSNADHPPLKIAWPDLGEDVVPTHFRIAVGLDERDEKLVEVKLAESGRLLGKLDIRFPAQFQVHEIELAAEDAAAIRREGVSLLVTRGSDLEVFKAGERLPDALRPHLLVPGTSDAMAEFFRRLDSLACVQAFGWMEGCVLDGLLDLSEVKGHEHLADTARTHLGLFFRDGKLIYENPRSRPSDGKVYGIEGTLPFAALARVEPDSPLFGPAIELWEQRRHQHGIIRDSSLTSEGSYTIAYPLARIAKARGSEKMMNDALFQCRIRQVRFFDGRDFGRTWRDGKRGEHAWARGVAWQLLGLARTLRVARGMVPTRDLEIDFASLAAWALERQREKDGLWNVFTNEAELAPDTGGSAGLAAALAIGFREGWVGDEALAGAKRTLEGLRGSLTPDGLLDGVAQSNKGGDRLQRGNYRVIYQMGMGLMAQLIAALEAS